jgi:hypothetical protein
MHAESPSWTRAFMSCFDQDTVHLSILSSGNSRRDKRCANAVFVIRLDTQRVQGQHESQVRQTGAPTQMSVPYLLAA